MAGTVQTNQLPLVQDITNASVIGIDKDGVDARFPLSILRGTSLGPYPGGVVSTPLPNQYYTLPAQVGTYANLLGVGGVPIVIPAPATGKAIADARATWTGQFWVAEYGLADVPTTKVTSTPGKNLFNKATALAATGLNQDGTLNTGSGGATYSLSDYIPVVALSNYYGRGTNSPNGARRVAFYNSAKVWQSPGADVNTNLITPPANIAFVRLQILTTNLDSFQFELGSAATAYEPYGASVTAVNDLPIKNADKEVYSKLETYTKNEVDTKVAPVADAVKSTDLATVTGKNLFDKSKATIGATINIGGALQQSSGTTAYAATDFIPVTPGQSYYGKGAQADTGFRRQAYYNAQKVYTEMGADAWMNTFTVPTGASFTRLGINVNNVDTFQLEVGTIATAYEAYKGLQVVGMKGFAIKNAEKDVYAQSETYNRAEIDSKVGGSGSSGGGVPDAGVMPFQEPIGDHNALAGYGQSLDVSNQTQPPLSLENVDGNLMLGNEPWVSTNSANLTVLNPLVAKPKGGVSYQTTLDAQPTDNYPCEPPIVGFANAVKKLLDAYLMNLADRKFIAASTGTGGSSIEILSKANNNSTYGTTRYANFIKFLDAAKAASAAAGKSIVVTAIQYMQGEANYDQEVGMGYDQGTNATFDKDMYKTYLKQLATDQIADVMSRYAPFQKKPPVFLIYQTGFSYTKGWNNTIGMAQLEAQNEDIRIVMSGPCYQVTDRGAAGGHLDPNGSRWMAEYHAKAYYKTVIKKEHWSPLQPKKITKGTTTLDIEFHVPVAPLQFNTRTVASVTNRGFSLKDAGVEKAIASVQILGSSLVRITVSTAFTGDVEVAYANQDRGGNGNLCDSDPWVAFSTYAQLPVQLRPVFEPKDSTGAVIYSKPYPMENWCVAFYYKLLAAQSTLTIF